MRGGRVTLRIHVLVEDGCAQYLVVVDAKQQRFHRHELVVVIRGDGLPKVRRQHGLNVIHDGVTVLHKELQQGQFQIGSSPTRSLCASAKESLDVWE